VGDQAPAFVLKTVAKADPRSLNDLIHAPDRRGAVLVFVSARCPYVAQARQPLGDLFRQYGGTVAFAGLNSNQNESADDVKTDAAYNFPFSILRDQGSKVADLYGAERTPEVFLIDAKGVIRYHGGVADLGAALGDFTAGRTVAKSEAKAFGCTIKRRPCPGGLHLGIARSGRPVGDRVRCAPCGCRTVIRGYDVGLVAAFAGIGVAGAGRTSRGHRQGERRDWSPIVGYG
jgi:peroxiredoxin